jgi:hypothetical protein
MPDSGDKDNASVKKASADAHRRPSIFSIAQVNVQENFIIIGILKKEKWI